MELNHLIVGIENRRLLRKAMSERVSQVIKCDAQRSEVLGEFVYQSFDIVSSGFCLECIDSSEEAFRSCVKKVSALSKPGGLFVMTLLKNSEFYKINDLIFPTFPVDEEYMQEMLIDFGFNNINLSLVDAEQNQGYEGIIALTAARST